MGGSRKSSGQSILTSTPLSKVRMQTITGVPWRLVLRGSWQKRRPSELATSCVDKNADYISMPYSYHHLCVLCMNRMQRTKNRELWLDKKTDEKTLLMSKNELTCSVKSVLTTLSRSHYHVLNYIIKLNKKLGYFPYFPLTYLSAEIYQDSFYKPTQTTHYLLIDIKFLGCNFGLIV